MPYLKNQSEKLFDNFLEQEAYEDVQGALFKLVRKAFIAGYEAGEKEAKHTEINSPFYANKAKV